jgi:hypothetical protein
MQCEQRRENYIDHRSKNSVIMQWLIHQPPLELGVRSTDIAYFQESLVIVLVRLRTSLVRVELVVDNGKHFHSWSFPTIRSMMDDQRMSAPKGAAVEHDMSCGPIRSSIVTSS